MHIFHDLNKKLEERRQRMQEIEEEEEFESEAGENEVVSGFKMPEREEEPEAQDQILARMNVDIDARLEEHSTFESNDVFVKSKEFRTFLYQFKAKRLRDAIPGITPDNEAELTRRLKAKIDAEMAVMTPQRGRQFFSKVRIILFPG